MSCQAEKRARVEAILGELAEISLAAAKELLTRIRESEDAAETAVLAGALQKITRSARLTVALDAKLDRDAAREARDAEQAGRQAAERARLAAVDAPRTVGPIESRKGRVTNLLQRLLWTEAESDSEEFEILIDDLDARLAEAARSPDFETTPVEVLAQRIAADMGLSGELTLSLGEPPPPGAASAAAAVEAPAADTG